MYIVTFPSHAVFIIDYSTRLFRLLIRLGCIIATRGAQERDPEAGINDVQARYRSRHQLGVPPLHHHLGHRAIPSWHSLEGTRRCLLGSHPSANVPSNDVNRRKTILPGQEKVILAGEYCSTTVTPTSRSEPPLLGKGQLGWARRCRIALPWKLSLRRRTSFGERSVNNLPLVSFVLLFLPSHPIPRAPPVVPDSTLFVADPGDSHSGRVLESSAEADEQ